MLTWRNILFNATKYPNNLREIFGEVMIVRTIILTVVCFFTVALSLPSRKFPYIEKQLVTLIKTVETRNCFVSYVKINGKQYLVKQKKDYKKQLAVVRDALSAWMAEFLNIAHRVDIISHKIEFPGKVNQNFPATLHTLAPGKTVREQRDNRFNALRLRQFWAQAATVDEKGLTRAIITYMTWHQQLPEIIALDLIIGNSDRHCGNLCYDPTTDTFCAIDMDDTFNKDLCLLACEKLVLIMKTDKVPFTRQEIRALGRMRDTLKLLLRKHKPQDIIAKLYFFAQKAGFSKGNALYNDRIYRKLLSYEAMIIATNASAHRLISLLNTIIARKSLEIGVTTEI